MSPLSGISRTSSVESQAPSRLERALTAIQAKTAQVAERAISFVKNSYERLEQGVDAGFAKFKGKLDNSKSFAKAETVMKQSHPEAKIKEDKPIQTAADPRTSKINEEMKQIEDKKTIAKLSNDVNQAINQIQAKPTKDADDKEKLERLQLMQGKLEVDPGFFLKKMEQYGHGKSELYKHLEPVGFLSILVISNQKLGILENMQKGYGNPSGLSEEERVALHHYTTKGYVALNQAGREAKLSGMPIQDPGMRACFDLTVSALKKLPDAPAVDAQGNQVTLKRSYFPPRGDPDPIKNSQAEANFKAFAANNFVEGHVFNDGSFLSTTVKSGVSGEYNVTFEIPEGSKTIPNGKRIGFPYSAFSSVNKSDEGEVLFSPEVEFKVSKVQGSQITFQFI